MAADTDLRTGLADWRRHLIAALITAAPLLMGAAMAWGTLSTKVQASVEQVSSMEARLSSVETQTAVVNSRLVEIKEAQGNMDGKLDRLLERRR